MTEMNDGTLEVELTVRRQETGALTITSIYKPDAEAMLKVLTKLLAKAPEEKIIGMPEQNSSDDGIPAVQQAHTQFPRPELEET
jgi:hypothetical protein